MVFILEPVDLRGLRITVARLEFVQERAILGKYRICSGAKDVGKHGIASASPTSSHESSGEFQARITVTASKWMHRGPNPAAPVQCLQNT